MTAANRPSAEAAALGDTRPNGPAATAYLAAGICAFMMGLMTTLSEASAAISSALNWYRPVGPLSGKVGVTLIGYLLSWLILHLLFRGKDVALGRYMIIAIVLLAIGFLGTFPPFFDLLAPE